jgi:hypothetical protein
MVLGIVAFLANPAGAVTIHSDGTPTSAMVSCSPGCQGFIGGGAPNFPTSMGTPSSTMADLYDLPNGNLTTATNALNILAGTTFAVSDGVKTDTGGVDSLTFVTDAAYFMIKIGGGTLAGSNAFFKILNPGGVTVTYDKMGQTSGGLSQIAAWGGGIQVIPLPAALPMLLGALGGMFVIGRRRRTAAA